MFQRPLLRRAFLFECALIPIAYVLGWLTSAPSLWRRVETAWGVWPSVALGVVATLPLVGFLLMSQRSRWRPLVHLRRAVRRLTALLFQDASLPELGAIALAAGVGEELLFRGWLQSWIARTLGWHPDWLPGIVIASILFGLMHAITLTYALAAALVGAYFGVLYLWTGNLMAPIVAHAAYDAFAMWYLAVRGRNENGGPEEDSSGAANDSSDQLRLPDCRRG